MRTPDAPQVGSNKLLGALARSMAHIGDEVHASASERAPACVQSE